MLPDQTIDAAQAATTLAAALGCGLLIGIERERRKGSGPKRAFAGVRTFSLTCVLGAAAALTGETVLLLVGAAFVAGLGLLAYWRDRSDDPGVTTEIALLLTYLIGVLTTWHLPVAAALAVGLTAMLAARQRLHQLASQWLSAGEVRDGIVLAALVLMALPLVPDQPLWGTVLNPRVIVQLLALLLAVQSLAHFCRRLLEARQAVAFSALASGFVSSTATIATLGLAVREQRADARLMAAGGLFSCVSTQVQVLLVASAVQPAWLGVLWLPTLGSAALAALWAWWLLRRDGQAPTDGAVSSPRIEGLPSSGSDRMFSLRGAAAVAALLAGIQALVHGMELWLGRGGLIVGTLLAALADLHSAMAAAFLSSTPTPGGPAVWAVVLALLVHAFSKSLTAGLVGGWRYLAWLAPGLWVHSALASAGIWWLVAR